MKKTPVTLKFDAAKLKALQYYLPKNGSSVEEELRKHMDEIYDERVPQDVKDFVHFQSGMPEESSQDQTLGGEDSDSKSGKRQSRSKKNEQSVESTEAVGQDMSMKM